LDARLNTGFHDLVSIHRFGVILLAFASLRVAAENPLWEQGKVVAVEEVSWSRIA
jgi:hypothetical protein